MSPLIATAGYATAVVDLTSNLSPLFIALVGLTALCAVLIAVEALRAHVAPQTTAMTDTPPVHVEYQQAA